jgi:hypothetical protein
MGVEAVVFSTPVMLGNLNCAANAGHIWRQNTATCPHRWKPILRAIFGMNWRAWPTHPASV